MRDREGRTLLTGTISIFLYLITTHPNLDCILIYLTVLMYLLLTSHLLLLLLRTAAVTVTTTAVVAAVAVVVGLV